MAREVTINDINITIVKDYEAMCLFATEMVREKIRLNTKMNFLVPTGSTPAGLYALMKEDHSDAFDRITFFNMDEYCVHVGGKMVLLPDTHPASYRRYMQENLFDRVTPMAKHFPGIENIQEEGVYDRLIKDSGGIDLCLNAMGEDGHTFGFNLPGTSFKSRTRLIKLNEETRGVNEKLTGLSTPEHAITIGLLTGMESKEIIFLVSGRRKADILRKVLFEQEPTPFIPATVLRKHNNCHWIVDDKAALHLGN